MIPITPGTRVRVRDTAFWPERRGCEGVVVDPPDPRINSYPGTKAVVLLDDDPIAKRRSAYPSRLDAFWAEQRRQWTCVIPHADLEVLTGGAEQVAPSSPGWEIDE